MRKFFAVVALLLAGSGVAFADSMPQVVNSTTNPTWTKTVYNDNGSTIVSGEIVIWDNDDTEFDRSGYPYVLKTTSADSPWVAGVVAPGEICPDQQLCEIVVEGPTIVKVADATDPFIEDTLVSTSTVSGQAGDYTAAANTCFLGNAMELRDVDNGADLGRDGSRYWVNVHIGCQ